MPKRSFRDCFLVFGVLASHAFLTYVPLKPDRAVFWESWRRLNEKVRAEPLTGPSHPWPEEVWDTGYTPRLSLWWIQAGSGRTGVRS